MNERVYGGLRPLFNLLCVAAMLFVLAPLLITLAISFSTGPFATFPPTGVTLDWYGSILGSREFLASLWLSFYLAVGSTLFALLVGVPAAYAIVRGEGLPGRQLAESLLLSPLLLPVLITGLSLLQFTTWTGISDAVANMFIGYVVVTIPYVMRTVIASLQLANRSLEEAARTLGANGLVAFRRVTLVQIAPGVMAGALFSFMVSLDNLTISMWFASSQASPLPIYMMKRMDSVFDPSIAAMAGVMLAVGSAMVLLIERLVGLRRSFGI